MADNVTEVSSRFTDVDEFIEDLDGGVFKEKLAMILSDVALAVVTNEKEGTVNIKMKIKQIGEGSQVNFETTTEFKKPSKYGSKGESSTKNTPMHVGFGGKVTLFPDGKISGNQQSFIDRKGDVTQD